MIDFDSLVLAPSFATFGESITYTPAGGAAFAPASGGIFQEYATEVDLDSTGVPVTTTAPICGVRLADFATPPAQGDQVTIRNIGYTVSDVLPDSKGLVKLRLYVTTS